MEQEYLTVSALTKYIKTKFDRDPHLDRVYLTGEISNFNKNSVHKYFNLKDENAIIAATMFQGAYKKIQFQPEEGMKVLVIGRVTVYEKSGKYQMIIEHMEPDGVGALYQAYEQLKKKLTEEGVFAGPKKPIPVFPKKIAILTSDTGAVIRDIQTTVARRFPIAQLVLYPTVVQGVHAVPSILKNLDLVEQSDADVVIIGRGGGSIEDLWAFNEEPVVRRVASFSLPIISSVGHETDTTLTDFAADQRAATPTAAAELATPVLNDIHLTLGNLTGRLQTTMLNQLNTRKELLSKLEKSGIFVKPERMYEVYAQQVDQLRLKLMQGMQQRLHLAKQQSMQFTHRLQLVSPEQLLIQQKQKLEWLHKQLVDSNQNYMQDKQIRFQQLVEKLDLLSPLKIMTRGYGIVFKDGDIVKSVDQIEEKQPIEIRLSDGLVNATVTAKNKESL